MYREKFVSVIIPALNEQQAIKPVVEELLSLQMPKCCQPGTDGRVVDQPVVDQIVVCDNGSKDNTAEVARVAGARVVFEPTPGYGAACYTAYSALNDVNRENDHLDATTAADSIGPIDDDKHIIVFVDGDYSVATSELPSLLEPILDGADLVIGSRVLGHCERGALGVTQRFGNWLASVLIRLLWRAPVTDLGPFRAITYPALRAIDMQDRAFGWTVEMQVRAIQLGQRVVEVPVSTKQRIGQSKISGTVKGILGAGIGILGMIGKLYWQQRIKSRVPVGQAEQVN